MSQVFVDFDHCGDEDENRKDCKDCTREQQIECEKDEE